MEKKASFLKHHADTLAIIAVNIAMMGILVSLFISNNSSISVINQNILSTNQRIDATNSRIDKTYNLIYDILNKDKK